MKVKDLIDDLKECPGGMEVDFYFCNDKGGKTYVEPIIKKEVQDFGSRDNIYTGLEIKLEW